MDVIERCPHCKGAEYWIGFAKCRGKFVCAVYCRNISCDGPPMVAYGRTKEIAQERAIKKWNRRVDNG